MTFLDEFYNRTYENAINNKMLYYDYDFPIEQVKKYVDQIINIPLNEFVLRAINSKTTESITPKDVFQFSSLEDGTKNICHILKGKGNPGVTFLEAGKLLLDDGMLRTDMAYKKYGENHLKIAESIGLLFELTRTYFVSCLGIVYLSLPSDEQEKLIIRLFLRNKLIARLIKASSFATVNARQFFYMLSDTTYIRRKSNIKSVLRFLECSKEYDFSPYVERIVF